MTMTRAVVVAMLVLCAGTALAGPPTITLDGHPYVDLGRLAATARASLDATPSSARAHLRSGGHVVILTRNWSQLLLDGRPIVLDAPVRVRGASWLVPRSFLTRVMPELTAPRAVVSAPASRPAPAAPSPRATVSSRGASPAPAAPPPRATASVLASAPAAPPLARPVAVKEVPFPPPTGRVTLEDLRFRSYPSFTRVVLETSAPLAHRIDATRGKEARVILLSLSGPARTEEVRDGLVDTVRLERSGADAVLRVLFEGVPGSIRTTTFADPPRLVVDFLRPDTGERAEATEPLRMIVLDAGHGGHDSGALGPTGLQEKELVLDVTRRVARLVQERLDLKVKLSRDGDYFVPLRDRTSFANKERADLFISIHANAHREVANEGVETYFLSSEATDTAARHVAALENSVVQLEAPASRGRADIVKTILWDLAQSQFQLESSRLAETVQDSMSQALHIPSRGVKQAGFYVLGGAAMPAVLIEIGFVTNPREEKKLKDSRYRDDIARAILDGIADYKRSVDGPRHAAGTQPRASLSGGSRSTPASAGALR